MAVSISNFDSKANIFLQKLLISLNIFWWFIILSVDSESSPGYNLDPIRLHEALLNCSNPRLMHIYKEWTRTMAHWPDIYDIC